MPLPTINDVQAVDPILTNMLIGYEQADNRFIASRLFPAVPLEHDSGTYYIVGKKYFFFDDLKPRAPGGNFQELGIGVSTDTVSTIQFAAAFPVADEVRANSQLPMDLITLGIKKLAQASLIRKEVAFAADFMVNSVWGTTDNNSATDWDDFSAGDPVANVALAGRTISNNTGKLANTLAVGAIVHEALVNNPDILDRLKYTQSATMATIEAAIAAILGVENYVVGRGVYSNTNESAAFSPTAIIDDDALLLSVDPGAGVFGATAGKTFYWPGGGGLGSVAPIWRDDSRDTDVVKHKEQWDQKITAADLGYLWLDIV